MSFDTNGSNKLSELNLTKNTHLNSIDCSSNQLSALDVSKITYLERLNCSNNHISQIDLSRIDALDFDNSDFSGQTDLNGGKIEIVIIK